MAGAGGGGGGGGAKASARPSSAGAAGTSGSKDESLLAWSTRTLLLVLISVMAFSIRLFSVVKYESVIHEFDPYFNYRVTRFLTDKGAYRMWDWFDARTWYPLGRVVGGTVYPGLILTAGLMHDALRWLNVPVHVQEVCVFTAPLFSALCALATYGLVRECSRGEGAGLAAAALVSIVPSYISRSVAGSFDNEGVAIFALVFVFYTFLKAHNTGRLAWTVASVAAYFYMVLSWGGYSFVINLIPIYALACVATGRMTGRLYGAFAPLVSAGTLLACSIPVVGFNAVFMSEHFGAFLAFGAVHVALAVRWIRSLLPAREFERAARLVALGALASLALAGAGVAAFVSASPTLGWTGRSLSLLDPTYASKYIPIIASVSEHQPPTWSSYVTDLHAAALLAPLGLVICFRDLTDGALFLVLYGVTSVYFSGVMVRLMLVLAPAACCLSGVAVSTLLGGFAAALRRRYGDLGGLLGGGGGGGGDDAAAQDDVAAAGEDEVARGSAVAAEQQQQQQQQQRGKGGKASGGKGGGGGGGGKGGGGGGGGKGGGGSSKGGPAAAATTDDDDDDGPLPSSSSTAATSLTPDARRLPVPAAALGTALVAYLLWRYAVHCVGVTADMYSAPSIVLQTARPDGSMHVFDDFREAYAWLRHNTPEDAKVASWWDYGYQTTAMANRTVIVDNNTWNNTHIATVGRAMASPELKGWRIFRSLDVDYVFVVFGGLIGYPSDDINKFLWMVRIGGGVFPEIKEADYLDRQGQYRIDKEAAPALVKSVMYKLSYYDFAPASRGMMGGMVVDRVRQTGIATEDIKLRHFEEAFTSQHWMMRVYRVLPAAQVERPAGTSARRAARQRRAGGKASSSSSA